MVEKVDLATLVAKFEADKTQFDQAMRQTKAQLQEIQRTTEKVGDKTVTTTRKMTTQWGAQAEKVSASTDKLGGLLKQIGQVVPGMSGLTSQVARSRKAMGDLGKTSEEQGPRLGKVGGAAGGAKSSFMGMGAGAAGAAAGVLVLAVVIGKVIQKIVEVGKKIVNWAFNLLRSTQVWQFARGILTDFVDFILGIFLDAVVTSFEEGGEGASTAMEKLWGSIETVAATIAPLIPKIVALAVTLVDLGVRVVLPLIEKFVDWISEGDRLERILVLIAVVVAVLASPLILLAAVVYSVYKVFQFWKAVLTPVYNTIKLLMEYVIRVVSPVFNTLKEGIERVANLVGGVFTTAWESITGVFSGVMTPMEGLSNVLGTVWDVLVGIAETISNVFMSAWRAVEGVVDGVARAFRAVWNIIAIYLQPVWDALMGAFNWAYTNVLEPIWDILMGIWDALVGVAGAVGGALGGVGDALGGAGEALGDLFGFQYGGPVYAEGPYKLHAGEFVLPAGGGEAIAMLLRNFPGGGGGNVDNSSSRTATTYVYVNAVNARDGWDIGTTVAGMLDSRIRSAVG